MEAEPIASGFKRWKFLVDDIIVRASLKDGTKLPVGERQELYTAILSALLEEEPKLLDFSGQPVKLQYPIIGYRARTERTIYIEEGNLEGIQELKLEGYRTPLLSI
jgi:hypothetical protein